MRVRVFSAPAQAFLAGARLFFTVPVGAALVLGASSAASATGYLSRTEVRSFIEDLQTEHGLDSTELTRILGDAEHQPTVVRLIGPDRRAHTKPPVRSYPRYRSKFLTKARIAAGVQYWDSYETYLERAEAQYGVPAEVILGIIGVETAYGQNTGSFRVVDALATIAFDGPRRQEYFREELKHFLLLTHEIGLDPLSIKGSYAGAMGLPQFMPSSYRNHAVDFDRDGNIDLVGSPADAIGSVAKYLQAYGWAANEVPSVPVRLPGGKTAHLVSGLQRAHTVAELKERGVKFLGEDFPDSTCSIVELPSPRKPSKYIAGFGNFEAITRYNRSTFYATAVLELAEAIRSARVPRITVTANRDAESGSTQGMQ